MKMIILGDKIRSKYCNDSDHVAASRLKSFRWPAAQTTLPRRSHDQLLALHFHSHPEQCLEGELVEFFRVFIDKTSFRACGLVYRDRTFFFLNTSIIH